MTQFNEAHRALTDQLDVLVTAATDQGVPAYIIVDTLTRVVNQQRKIAEASTQEGAGQYIVRDGVNQTEAAARAESPTDAAPSDLTGQTSGVTNPTPPLVETVESTDVAQNAAGSADKAEPAGTKPATASPTKR